MKNSPEHILKKMYTSEKRSWFNDCGFRSLTSLSMTHIVPDAVIPLTGNTTVKLDLQQYLLSEGTPNPIYEGMRVDMALYFCPQRLYTRGIYGNNIEEAVTLEKLPLPRADLFIYKKPSGTETTYTGDVKAILHGSLLERLGVPAQLICQGGNIPLDSTRVFNEDLTFKTLAENNLQNMAHTYVNYAVVAAYYDIMRSYFSNKFQDMVPVAQTTWEPLVDFPEYENTIVSARRETSWRSLSVFGERINWLRGVLNADESVINGTSATSRYFADSAYQMYSRLAFTPSRKPSFETERMLYFADVPLLDTLYYSGLQGAENSNILEFVKQYENAISNTGLWSTRYDSHYNTMFFDKDDIGDLVAIHSTSSTGVQDFRLAEARYVTYLKAILRGRTTEDWIDAQYGGNRLKMHDKPIFVGSDSFIVNFQQIVASASGDGVRLGDTAGRASGGSRSAFSDKAKGKTIVFTTQEPGYLISIVKCTPPVSYRDTVQPFHSYSTLADFPLPQYSGRAWQNLLGSAFGFTGRTSVDNGVVGVQPYGFDHMTAHSRVSALMATKLKSGFSFVRNAEVDWNVDDVLQSYRSTYVEGGVFDNNFYDTGVNGRQNFTLLTSYNLRKCMPLEKQVTNYDIL